MANIKELIFTAKECVLNRLADRLFNTEADEELHARYLLELDSPIKDAMARKLRRRGITPISTIDVSSHPVIDERLPPPEDSNLSP